MDRRQLFRSTAAAAAGLLFAPRQLRAAPSAPVSIGRCGTYEPREVTAALGKMFDQLGGVARLVQGKTVAIKVNLTGEPDSRVNSLPVGETHYTHPTVIGALVHLIGRAGAQRIRILESPMSTNGSLEEIMRKAGWNVADIANAAPRVEFENTNYLGAGTRYHRLAVPFGGLVFPAYDLNHSYDECDVFVSVAKLKEHNAAGVTLSMKNSFGITPATIYGSGAGADEPSIEARGNRAAALHSGNRTPSRSAPQELHPDSPRQAGYRVPRAVVDLVAARPVHLQVIDGIRTIAGGEGPWGPIPKTPVAPRALIAGTNPVATDAIAMAVMGYDPMADRGASPFETADNMLRLAEDAGLGTRDLNRIEVAGVSIKGARFDFAALRRERQRQAFR
jgi:uncharacterized protein (DUF362 family)